MQKIASPKPCSDNQDINFIRIIRAHRRHLDVLSKKSEPMAVEREEQGAVRSRGMNCGGKLNSILTITESLRTRARHYSGILTERTTDI